MQKISNKTKSTLQVKIPWWSEKLKIKHNFFHVLRRKVNYAIAIIQDILNFKLRHKLRHYIKRHFQKLKIKPGRFSAINRKISVGKFRKKNAFKDLQEALPRQLSRKTHWFYKGCPQGFCLDPFLRRIFVNKLLRLLKKFGYKVFVNVDDILLINYCQTCRQLEKLANEYCL